MDTAKPSPVAVIKLAADTITAKFLADGEDAAGLFMVTCMTAMKRRYDDLCGRDVPEASMPMGSGSVNPRWKMLVESVSASPDQNEILDDILEYLGFDTDSLPPNDTDTIEKLQRDLGELEAGLRYLGQNEAGLDEAQDLQPASLRDTFSAQGIELLDLIERLEFDAGYIDVLAQTALMLADVRPGDPAMIAIALASYHTAGEFPANLREQYYLNLPMTERTPRVWGHWQPVHKREL